MASHCVTAGGVSPETGMSDIDWQALVCLSEQLTACINCIQNIIEAKIRKASLYNN